MFIDLIFITVLTRGLFTSFHAAAAEGIQTSLLVELSYSKGYDSMRHCNPVRLTLFSHTAMKYRLFNVLSTGTAHADIDSRYILLNYNFIIKSCSYL